MLAKEVFVQTPGPERPAVLRQCMNSYCPGDRSSSSWYPCPVRFPPGTIGPSMPIAWPQQTSDDNVLYALLHICILRPLA